MHALKIKSILLGMFLIITSAITLHAISAYPRFLKITQKDGSELTIKKIGDEKGHYVTTKDGEVIVPGKDGKYFYAELNADNQLVASKFLASDDPSFATLEFLKSQDSKKLVDYAEQQLKKITQISSRSIPEEMKISHFPNFGKQKAIVVLVDYADVKFNTENPHEYFDALLNQEGFNLNGGTGSVHDYFYECSSGQFDPEFDVYGPVTLDHDMAYYGGTVNGQNDAHANEMAIEACKKLDAEVDFSQYDRDNDGFIDNVFIFYAGQGENAYGAPESVWPHSSKIFLDGWGPRCVFDGKILDTYGCTNEWLKDCSDHVGTFIHEFSHIMGIPDLYATNGQNNATPGAWSVMDVGPYNNEGNTPPLYSAFERMSIGWMKPRVITEGSNINLLPISENIAYCIETEKDNEFFLFENRQQSSWDSSLPYHGMLVWHIDYDSQIWNLNAVNNDNDHMRVRLVRANGDDYSWTLGYQDTRTDPFPGILRRTTFTANTTPGMVSYQNEDVDMPITNISESKDGMITFKVKDGGKSLPAPKLKEPTELEGTSMILNWEPVTNATSYFIKLQEDGRKESILNNVEITDVETYQVKGLKPHTLYHFKVMAAKGAVLSPYSDDMVIRTTGLTLADESIVATEATEVTATSFVANWEVDARADDYMISLKELIPADFFTVTADFNDNKIPEGWTTNVEKYEDGSAYQGKAVPAMLLSNDGDWLQTPIYDKPISKLSLNVIGVGVYSSFCSISVYALVDDQWQQLEDLKPLNKSQVNEVILPEMTRSVKLIYNRSRTANTCIDDVTIEGGNDSYEVDVPEYQDYHCGNVNSLLIENLKPETEYLYTLKGTDGQRISPVSNTISVKTEAESRICTLRNKKVTITSGIGFVNVENATNIYIYDVMGHPVYQGHSKRIPLNSGLYIVKADNVSRKVIVK